MPSMTRLIVQRLLLIAQIAAAVGLLGLLVSGNGPQVYNEVLGLAIVSVIILELRGRVNNES